ncbi:MAG: hypothetical protein DWH79_01720 [Planctomycetota bacterium]|nr:MAG: hypothetical protein DWH79_01720 [Planctomycetota bacterium]
MEKVIHDLFPLEKPPVFSSATHSRLPRAVGSAVYPRPPNRRQHRAAHRDRCLTTAFQGRSILWGTDHAREALVAGSGDARHDLVRRGFDCRLEGIVWTTGENDAFFGPFAQHHAATFQALVEQTRIDLKQPQLPWVIAALHRNAPWGNGSAVNAGLTQLARTLSGIEVVETSQLPYLRAQYGTHGTLLLGEKLAAAFLPSLQPALAPAKPESQSTGER